MIQNNNEPIIAYKLFRERKDGSIGSPFINKKQRLELNTPYLAKAYNKSGFKFRPGWHCCQNPIAPHIKTNPKSGEKRVWYKVAITDVTVIERSEKYGGNWLLAQNLTILERVDQ